MKSTSLLFYSFLFFLTLPLFAKKSRVGEAKKEEQKLVQFSGIVIDSDSLKPIPFTSVIIKNSNRGTVCDYFGYFSFVAQEKDTIIFSAIGFKNGSFIIPDTLSNNKYSLIQVLRGDTITLSTVQIYPWPTKEQFKSAFLKLNLPDDNLAQAKKNMGIAERKAQIEGIELSAAGNYKLAMQQYYSRMYYAGGQLPPNNLLNPVSWYQFIQAWKNGDFKKQ